MALFVGTDIGGTFTDIVGFHSDTGTLSFGKKLTNRDDLVEGVVSCLHEVKLDPSSIDLLKHGTTEVINTLLERRGARTALVVTAGFRDLLEIGRAGRPVAFDLDYAREPPLIERNLCFEIGERIDARGEIVLPLDRCQLQSLAAALKRAEVDAIAISLLNSYLNPIHEIEIARFLRDELPGVYITTGCELSREWFEYERTSTAVANAYIGPRTAGYVNRFDERLAAESFHGVFYMMGSNGGVLPVNRARQQPIALIESGPIGGCVGASVYAKALNINHIIAFDMGGTTAKCALVENGFFDIQASYFIGGYDRGLPLRTPVLDIVEVGTGGGSIASVEGQRLRVGPKSAGSEPGPVCFGRGGTEPTVTDANLVLSRISGGRFLNGSLPLDAAGAEAAVMERVGSKLGYAGRSSLDEVASGILTLANMQMATAIKEITIERGRDVRDFVLFAFGGGGPLHGVDLARELRIPKVIIPPEPGNFSALGMLFANARVDDVRSLRIDVNDVVAASFAETLAEMEARVTTTLHQDFSAESIFFELRAEMRFRGQKHSLRIPFTDGEEGAALKRNFFDAYRRRYGHVDEQSQVEIIGIRVAGFATTEIPDLGRIKRIAEGPSSAQREFRDVYSAMTGKRVSTPVYSRDQLTRGFIATGPLIIEEFGSTTVIGPGDTVELGDYGELSVNLNH